MLSKGYLLVHCPTVERSAAIAALQQKPARIGARSKFLANSFISFPRDAVALKQG